ncbi:hypothetical protein BHR79_09120 [Methanohalophilus halophilus]|uniref:Uncharacterized protein n=2 Tax=Methanohalophilus halophilus TaxID=2177 RepID=A0A1L3Q454_9EURY|nr:hypothetical protein BHR79_09120 [Methanohalophilus halophilus]RNI09039.1 hypothetical protein EFE40_06145 [Methanohalophilus halophilus]SDW33480.1 hypothetical protein SAMN04515625_0736 [Methanohalophilus halophilus]
MMELYWDAMAENDSINHETKALGRLKVEVQSQQGTGGQVLIWAPAENNQYNSIVKSDDGYWDCIFARLYSSVEEANKAYDDFSSEEQIDSMMSRCGFGGSACQMI